MPRAGLSPDAVVDAAMGVVDNAGPDRADPGRGGRRGRRGRPSLYKHIESLDSLHRHIAVRSMNELADRLIDAVLGQSKDDALRR